MTSIFDYSYHLAQFPAIFANQWKSGDALERMQSEKLQQLVRHSYANVLYYRRLFDAHGLAPDDIRSVRDLAAIPILNKDAILANFPGDIVAKNVSPDHYSERMTSGSSGKKLNVYLDHKAAALYRLMQLRQLIELGYKPWYKAVYIRYGLPVTTLAIQKLGLLRRSYVPLEWPPERQLDGIMKIRPDFLNAYPSVLYLLAKTVSEEQAAQLGLKFILSNSELLTPGARKTIEEAFHCGVYDDYSCLEFSAVGYECRKQHLHVALDNVIVEIVDEEGRPLPPGEKGRIVVTALNNYAMPYIRYEIGDVGILSGTKCPCGRTFPFFESILGRSDDFIALPDGQMIDPQSVVFQIEPIGEVKEFRILQDANFSITVLVVLHEDGNFNAVRRQILKNLQTVLDDTVKIDVAQIAAIDRGATGKHRSVVSRISAV